VQIAPAFRSWTRSARLSWDELAEVAIYVRAELEISLYAWGQACVVLGSTSDRQARRNVYEVCTSLKPGTIALSGTAGRDFCSLRPPGATSTFACG